MKQNKLANKRWKKILKRRKLKAHKNRVGPQNYYSDRICTLCAQCGKSRKLHQMTYLTGTGGAGIGQCKFCVVKLGKEENEKETNSGT